MKDVEGKRPNEKLLKKITNNKSWYLISEEKNTWWTMCDEKLLMKIAWWKMPLENFSSCSFDQAILLGIFHWAFFIRSFFWLCYQSFFNGWLDQAILTCGLASERNFPIKCGLANMRNNFFATKKTKKHRRWFSRKKFTGRPGGSTNVKGKTEEQ